MEVTDQIKKVATYKPRLSFWQIWNMSFGFFGIQFGWGLQMGNMSAIYEYLGAKPDQIPILWLAAPLTGLIVQPIIGSLSDHTWGRFGRRRPYFFAGAVLSSVALVFMPMSSYLWMAAGLLWILDTSINISMEPFRAFVADMLPSEQRTKGFAMQSFFIGIGAVLASILPYLLHVVWKVDKVHNGHAIPDSVRISFYAGAVVFFGAVLYTVLRTKEYPPEDMEKFHREKEDKKSFRVQVKEITNGIFHMPVVMRQLALVQFFTWMGLFFMWIYFTVAIPKTCFGNPPVGSQEYITATQWGSVCFGFYSLITFLFAFLLPRMAHVFSRKTTHVICLFLGGVSLIAVWFIHNPYLLLLPMTGVGIAWASILAMPYAILSTHIPQEKMGLFMGIFNFFIVLPEIISTLFFGFVLSHFLHNDTVLAVVTGGVVLIIAGLLMLRVYDHEKELG
ncbi:MAG: MFS transporter [Chitinophagaceae bacterium]|nr:MAG: MFS transporter [Chitinophagaceae bacterium]